MRQIIDNIYLNDRGRLVRVYEPPFNNVIIYGSDYDHIVLRLHRNGLITEDMGIYDNDWLLMNGGIAFAVFYSGLVRYDREDLLMMRDWSHIPVTVIKHILGE